MTPPLRKEIELELGYLRETATAVGGLLEKTSERPADIYDQAAAAMLMAQFYNGMENIMMRICKHYEKTDCKTV